MPFLDARRTDDLPIADVISRRDANEAARRMVDHFEALRLLASAVWQDDHLLAQAVLEECWDRSWVGKPAPDWATAL